VLRPPAKFVGTLFTFHGFGIMMKRNARARARGVLGASLVLVAAGVSGVVAQQPVHGGRPLTLEEALRLAEASSEGVAVARAGVKRADGDRFRARSEYFPQLGAQLYYTRTLASEFESLSSTGPDTIPSQAPCSPFTPNPTLPLEARLDSLERALECQANANPFGAFEDLPFGQANQYFVGLTASQTLFSGGRVQAQVAAARSGRTSAEIELLSTRAQLMLDVAQAYFDAALADHLVAIAEATLEQAETTLGQVRVAREVGQQSEFELLRAQVARATQEPVAIERRSDRDLAYIRLKQLLDLPQDAPLVLRTELGDAETGPIVGVVFDILGIAADTAVEHRAPVRQAVEAVEVQQNLRQVAASQRYPSISVSSSYGRVGYPRSGLPAWNDFRTNWTVTASAQIPIFTGGRIRGDVLVAEANVDQARAQLELTRELAAFDSRTAVERLQAAEATWAASVGTVEQADRAYQIADIRFREGISTQLELNDSRLALQQAQANRALAGRDVRVARLRVALLPFLPLGGVNATAPGTAGARGAAGALQASPQPVAPQPPQTVPPGSIRATQVGRN
jgi:outer membrane protein TolC